MDESSKGEFKITEFSGVSISLAILVVEKEKNSRSQVL